MSLPSLYVPFSLQAYTSGTNVLFLEDKVIRSTLKLIISSVLKKIRTKSNSGRGLKQSHQGHIKVSENGGRGGGAQRL